MNKIVVITFVLITTIVISCSKKDPQDAETVYSRFKIEENLDLRIAMFEEFMETNAESEFLQPMLSRIISGILKNKKFTKAADYLKENSELATPRMYNSIAWKIFETKENLELGAEIARKGVECAREDLKSSEGNKPDKLTEEEWNNSKKQSLAFILDTYGSIEKELNYKENSLSAFKEAVMLTNEEYGEINENYISVLIDKKDYENAQSSLEKYISSGTDSKNMKTILNEVYIKLGGIESEFVNYLSKFEAMARQKMINKLNSEIKNEQAPKFELIDFDGKTIKLSDYKGKTVILDFWATWCGPCLQSFPAMKKAIEKFSSNSNIKFLFANTWERVDDKKQNATDFIKANNYPFHVLMDEKNEVVEKYNVRGIPTKFIIDKNQNIRFESIGYGGKEDELVEELSYMISMIE